MASKTSTNDIKDMSQDWGMDTSVGLPYSGAAVQKFIKDRLNSKAGFFHYEASGCRYYSDGAIYGAGERGYVWLSSSNSQNNAYYLYFYSSFVSPQYSYYRSYAHSVRPVLDIWCITGSRSGGAQLFLFMKELEWVGSRLCSSCLKGMSCGYSITANRSRK